LYIFQNSGVFINKVLQGFDDFFPTHKFIDKNEHMFTVGMGKQLFSLPNW
jgi:hypothetical protein